MDRQELEAWLRLTLTHGVGNDTARRLLAAFGLPQHVFAQSSTALRQLLTPAQASALAQPPDDLATQLQTCLDWLDAAEDGMPRRIVSLGDAAYPQALLAIEDPPCLLYLLGRLATLDDGSDTATTLTGQAQTAIESGANHWPLRAMAIVGSRNPTPQGSANARQFARTLAAQGICVVSGLALGIDGAAHEGALDGAPPSAPGPATIAVIGTGIDRVYPRQHRDLAHRIAARGLIVSEYPLGTPPLPGNFPRRNRLIAGLSQGTLVVEAALQSGSLITARLASEQGKEVFAIPGSIHSPQSRGSHALIRQGAKLVETAQDVLEELRWPQAVLAMTNEAAGAVSAPDDDLNHPHQELLQALGADPVSLDALQARTGLQTATLQAQLLELELAGQVGRLPGGLFQRLGQA